MVEYSLSTSASSTEYACERFIPIAFYTDRVNLDPEGVLHVTMSPCFNALSILDHTSSILSV